VRCAQIDPEFQQLVWMGRPIPDHLRCRGALRYPAFPQHSGDRARRCFGGTGAQLRSRETQRKRLRG
jgi:hypothetical protein